jgi:hypothetical protein
MWAAAENTVIIIGASMPCLHKLLIEILFKKAPASTNHTSSNDLDIRTARKPTFLEAVYASHKTLRPGAKIPMTPVMEVFLGGNRASQNGILVIQQFTVIKQGEKGSRGRDAKNKFGIDGSLPSRSRLMVHLGQHGTIYLR